MNEKVLILDFGSQYTQLIARRVREQNVYCEIHPFNHFPSPDASVKGIILSGSPSSVNDADAPNPELDALLNAFPVLGVCYGAQLLAKKLGGEVAKSAHREYGRAIMTQSGEMNMLTDGMSYESQVWMSHADTITKLPEQTTILAATTTIPVAAFRCDAYTPVYGIQFHPESCLTEHGVDILRNFIVIADEWNDRSPERILA